MYVLYVAVLFTLYNMGIILVNEFMMIIFSIDVWISYFLTFLTKLPQYWLLLADFKNSYHLSFLNFFYTSYYLPKVFIILYIQSNMLTNHIPIIERVQIFIIIITGTYMKSEIFLVWETLYTNVTLWQKKKSVDTFFLV